MLLRLIVAIVCFAAVPLVPVAADEAAVKQESLRAAIEKSLPLLMTGATGHRDNSNRGCFGCHNQGPPLFAIAAAKERGFKIDEAELGKHLTFITKFLDNNRENYLQGKGTGGQADTAGYALWTLAAGGCQPCETTAAVAEYLLLRNKDQDNWPSTSKRPPTEATPFTTTYVALYGLASYGTPAQADRIAARRTKARDWLIKTPPKEHEERVFRLWGLDAAGASQSDIAAAAKELLAKQRDDGGWAQLDSGEPETALRSDPYATGTALVALHQVGGLAISDPAYERGLSYLLKTQLEDGSWHVISRSKPFQPYFETGFPHGNDQFISAAASGWATWALVLACDK